MNNFYQSLLDQRDPNAEALQNELMNQYKASLDQRQKVLKMLNSERWRLNQAQKGLTILI